MSHPSKSPEAKARDERDARIHASRPGAVKFACQLLWITLGLAVLSLLPGVRAPLWAPDLSAVDILINIVFALLMLLLEAWLIQLVYMRRNWARWLLLVLLALGWIQQLSSLSTSLEEGVAAFVLDTLSMLLEMAACYQLFISPGRRWFEASAPRG